MNLDLIKKYEKEFLHMLHGGKLKYFTGKEWLSYSSTEIWTGNNDLKIVIDDVYYTYRIALAEGKTVQYKGLSIQTWCTAQLSHIFGNIHVSNYRIKPEEPRFKVGDYVRYIHTNSPKPLRIINIHCERYYFENAEIILRVDEIEKWEPREGEICIFWDNYTEDAFISKFSYMENDGKYMCAETSWWDNCMPFTGTLPPHMKDNK